MGKKELKTKNRLPDFIKQCKLELPHRVTLDQTQLSSFEILPCLFHGGIARRAVLALQTRGCSFLRRPQGGCLHCGLAADGIIADDVDHVSQISRFEQALKRLHCSDCPVLCVYVPGSFLDDDEIDRETRNQIFSIVSKQKGIRKIVLESLPQFVTEKKINDLHLYLPDKEIEIALGLDSQDDQIRRLCINKDFSLKIFEKACALLKRHEIAFSAFALIKPPFLTEGESIDDAIKTCRYLFDIGAAAVSIEPNTVQKHTVTWKLYEKNLYRPPWLWSMIEVLQNLPPGFEARVGGIVVYPRAVQSAYNCSRCSQTVWQKLQDFNLCQDKNIFNGLECDCKIKWREELKKTDLPITTRIAKIVMEFEK
jgi:radical SAM enzyme (TIGR01210 family)